MNNWKNVNGEILLTDSDHWCLGDMFIKYIQAVKKGQSALIKNRHQVLLLVLSEFKRFNHFLFPLKYFSNDFGGGGGGAIKVN